MKKSMLAAFLAATVVFAASPGMSYLDLTTGLPYSPGAPVDSILAYGNWIPSDANHKDALATLLGITVVQLNEMYPNYYKDEAVGVFDYKSLPGYDPGFSWDYAIVKVDGPNDFSYLNFAPRSRFSTSLGC